MEINQINLPFVLMDVVQHYIQISKQKREIKTLAATFDGCSLLSAHTLAYEAHKNPKWPLRNK